MTLLPCAFVLWSHHRPLAEFFSHHCVLMLHIFTVDICSDRCSGCDWKHRHGQRKCKGRWWAAACAAMSPQLQDLFWSVTSLFHTGSRWKLTPRYSSCARVRLRKRQCDTKARVHAVTVPSSRWMSSQNYENWDCSDFLEGRSHFFHFSGWRISSFTTLLRQD